MEMKALIAAVAALTERVATLEKQVTAINAPRDRGPKSEKTMTEAHAFAVKHGEDKDLGHKKAAEKHGLSYGQVFSCRGGYTFKQVKADWKPKAAETAPETAPSDTTAQQ